MRKQNSLTITLPIKFLLKDWKEHAEADCFFCFTNLMSDIRDFFIKSLDEAESGINGIMTRLMNKVGRLDPEVKRVLDSQDIRPQYFSFRYARVNQEKGHTVCVRTL